jgi:hypothetical protein
MMTMKKMRMKVIRVTIIREHLLDYSIHHHQSVIQSLGVVDMSIHSHHCLASSR